MNEELVSRFVDSIIYRAGRITARDDDPRIASGELITERQARRLLTPDVRRSLIESEREMEREIREAFLQGIRGSTPSNFFQEKPKSERNGENNASV